MGKTITYHFDPVDLEQMRLRGRLTPGQRIQAMLDAQALALGAEVAGFWRAVKDAARQEADRAG